MFVNFGLQNNNRGASHHRSHRIVQATEEGSVAEGHVRAVSAMCTPHAVGQADALTIGCTRRPMLVLDTAAAGWCRARCRAGCRAGCRARCRTRRVAPARGGKVRDRSQVPLAGRLVEAGAQHELIRGRGVIHDENLVRRVCKGGLHVLEVGVTGHHGQRGLGKAAYLREKIIRVLLFGEQGRRGEARRGVAKVFQGRSGEARQRK